MISTAERELEQAGVRERPEVVVGDAGYWSNRAQSTGCASAGSSRSSPPTPTSETGHARRGSADPTTSCEERFRASAAASSTRGARRWSNRSSARSRPTAASGASNTGGGRRPLGMAIDRGHPQPPEAPPAHARDRSDLSRGPERPAVLRSCSNSPPWIVAARVHASAPRCSGAMRERRST
jgi:hypothetical protein